MKTSSPSPGVTHRYEKDGARIWEASDGSRLALDWSALTFTPPKSETAERIPLPWSGNDVKSLVPRADFKAALASVPVGVVELTLPGGHPTLRSSTQATATYAAYGRIVCVQSHTELATVHDPRGPQRIACARISVPRHSSVASACDGKIVVLYSAMANATALYAMLPHGMVLLARADVGISQLCEAGNRVFLVTRDGDWFELAGLEAAYEQALATHRAEPAPKPPTAEWLATDPRLSTQPSDADRTGWPGAAYVLLASKMTFAVHADAAATSLSWRHDGAVRKIPLPVTGAIARPDDGQLRVVVSPMRAHALVFRQDEAWLVEVNLATGAVERQLANDSSPVGDACYLDEDLFAWTTWNWEIYLRGVESSVAFEDSAGRTSIAGVPVGDGRYMLAAVAPPDADEPQRLVVDIISGLGTDDVSYDTWDPFALGNALATVERHGDDILLEVGTRSCTLRSN